MEYSNNIAKHNRCEVLCCEVSETLYACYYRIRSAIRDAHISLFFCVTKGPCLSNEWNL